MKAGQKILLAVNALILLGAAISGTEITRLHFLYATDSAAEQWEKDTGTRYSQISVYAPQIEAFSIPDAHGLRYNIGTKLKNDNTIDKHDEGWSDCASVQTRGTVTYNKHDQEVVMTGTWGDFFGFHPEELASGSYYSENDINLFRAVIDDMTAWSLYGSVDASELTFFIGDKEFEVAGVVKSPLRADDQVAYGELPHIYIPIEAMSYINEGIGLTSYEACVPYKVDGYAASVMKDYFSDNAEIVDQTGRFDIVKLVKGYKELPKSVMIQKGTLYPWYENSVRAAEMKARILAFPTAILLLIPAVSLVYLLFVTAKGIGRLFRFIAGKIDDRKQKRLKKAYERRKALEKASQQNT